MAFVADLIAQHFQGSFYDAVKAVIEKNLLTTEGHGKGLAAAIVALPLTPAEVDRLTSSLPTFVARGFASAWLQVVLTQVKETDETLKHAKHLDATRRSGLKKKRPEPKPCKLSGYSRRIHGPGHKVHGQKVFKV
jgi:hypothetical protein